MTGVTPADIEHIHTVLRAQGRQIDESAAAISAGHQEQEALRATITKLAAQTTALREQLQEALIGKAGIKIIEVDAASIYEAAYRNSQPKSLLVRTEHPRQGGIVQRVIDHLDEMGHVIGKKSDIFLPIEVMSYAGSSNDVELLSGVRGHHVFIAYTSRHPERSVFVNADGSFNEQAYRLAVLGIEALEQSLVLDIAQVVKASGGLSCTLIASQIARARSDRAVEKRGSVGVQRTLSPWNDVFDNIIFVHPHNEQSMNISTSVKFNLAAHDIVAVKFWKDNSDALDSIDLINAALDAHIFAAPDVGASQLVKRCLDRTRAVGAAVYIAREEKKQNRQFTKAERKAVYEAVLKHGSMAIVDKDRVQPGVSKVTGIVGNVKNKKVLLIDDMIDSGGTTINAAESLLEAGAESVDAYATHGILTGDAVKKLQGSRINTITITDTIAHGNEVSEASKFTVISVAPLIANCVMGVLRQAEPNIRLRPTKPAGYVHGLKDNASALVLAHLNI